MKLFVWDFHGTLEQGNERAVVDISNAVLANFWHAERFTECDMERLYGLRWIKYFEDLLPAAPAEEHQRLQRACFELSGKRWDMVCQRIKPAPYAHEVLSAVAASQHEQILISNTQPNSLPKFLDAVNMAHYFRGRALAAGMHFNGDGGKTKEQILAEYLDEKSYDTVVCIGDSTQDIGLVKVTPGISYLYAHPWRKFKECDTDYKINDLRDVLREI